MSAQEFYLEGEKGKPAVLLLHSLADSPEIMQSLAGKIHQAGYSVLSPTLSGHATGTFTDIFEQDMKQWVADGEDSLEELKAKGHEKIVVAGLSLGSLIAVDLMVKHSELIGLVCIATPMLGDLKESRVPLFMRQKFFQSLEHTPTIEDREAAQGIFDRLDEVLTGINKWMDEIFEDLFSIDVPVFIAQGQADEVINPKIAERFQRSLRSAQKVDYHSYPEGTHYLVETPMVNELAADLLKFLKKIN